MKKEWDQIISSEREFWKLNFSEIYEYRDLIVLFVRRDFITVYKQTILGPLWYLITPLLTSATFTVIFGKIAKLSTDGLDPFLFYLSGITFWQYFSDCLLKNANIFAEQQDLFSKVYFPRRIVPITTVISNLAKFGVQFLLFILVLLTLKLLGHNFSIQYYLIFLLPFILVFIAMLGSGIGMVFSSMTAKYKDLTFLLAFFIQIWMYLTPVIYPINTIPESYLRIIRLNPMANFIDALRYIFTGSGNFDPSWILYSICASLGIFAIGNVVFSYTEGSFVDSI